MGPSGNGRSHEAEKRGESEVSALGSGGESGGRRAPLGSPLGACEHLASGEGFARHPGLPKRGAHPRGWKERGCAGAFVSPPRGREAGNLLQRGEGREASSCHSRQKPAEEVNSGSRRSRTFPSPGLDPSGYLTTPAAPGRGRAPVAALTCSELFVLREGGVPPQRLRAQDRHRKGRGQHAGSPSFAADEIIVTFESDGAGKARRANRCKAARDRFAAWVDVTLKIG